MHNLIGAVINVCRFEIVLKGFLALAIFDYAYFSCFGQTH